MNYRRRNANHRRTGNVYSNSGTDIRVDPHCRKRHGRDAEVSGLSFHPGFHAGAGRFDAIHLRLLPSGNDIHFGLAAGNFALDPRQGGSEAA